MGGHKKRHHNPGKNKQKAQHNFSSDRYAHNDAKTKKEDVSELVKTSTNWSGLRGLNNHGNTCFFNSVLQNLTQTIPLRTHLVPRDPMNPRETANAGKATEDAVSAALRNFMIHMWLGNGNVHSPAELLYSVAAKVPRFGRGQQQDSHELLRFLLDQIDTEVMDKLKNFKKMYLGKTYAEVSAQLKVPLQIPASPSQSAANAATNHHMNESASNSSNSTPSPSPATATSTPSTTVSSSSASSTTPSSGSNSSTVEKSQQQQQSKSQIDPNFVFTMDYFLDRSKGNIVTNPAIHLSPYEINQKSSLISYVESIFGGRLESTIVCHSCGTISSTYETFLDLSIPIPPRFLDEKMKRAIGLIQDPKQDQQKGKLQNKSVENNTNSRKVGRSSTPPTPPKPLSSAINLQNAHFQKRIQMMVAKKAAQSASLPSTEPMESSTPDPTMNTNPNTFKQLKGKQSKRDKKKQKLLANSAASTISEYNYNELDALTEEELMVLALEFDTSPSTASDAKQSEVAAATSPAETSNKERTTNYTDDTFSSAITLPSPSEKPITSEPINDAQTNTKVEIEPPSAEINVPSTQEQSEHLVNSTEQSPTINEPANVSNQVSNSSPTSSPQVQSVCIAAEEPRIANAEALQKLIGSVLGDPGPPPSTLPSNVYSFLEDNPTECTNTGEVQLKEVLEQSLKESGNSLRKAGPVFNPSLIYDARSIVRPTSLSIEACLYEFTEPEVLFGENAFGCYECTKRAWIKEGRNLEPLILEYGSMDEKEALRHQILESSSSPEEILIKLDKLDIACAKEETSDSESSSASGDESLKTEDTNSSHEDSNEKEAEQPNGKEAIKPEDTAQEEKAVKHKKNGELSKSKAPKSIKLLNSGTATKQILIDDLPSILTLHLKRFWTTLSGSSKLDHKVEFKTLLDMSPYISRSAQNGEDKHKRQKPIHPSSCKYLLYGIVVHSGSLGSGHYVAYTRRRDSPICDMTSLEDVAKGWHYFSDTSMSAASLETVLGQQAYILFYERISE